MPQGLTPLLMLLDGTRDLPAIHAEFCHLVGGEVPLEVITEAIAQLDSAFLLENENAVRAQAGEIGRVPDAAAPAAGICRAQLPRRPDFAAPDIAKL
jgi:hypothetical protein